MEGPKNRRATDRGEGKGYGVSPEEEILFCHNNSTVKYDCKNNIQGWPPTVMNNAQYKIISKCPRVMCKH